MRHYVFDESDVVNFKYCPHCGKELFSVYQGDYAGYLECSECDGCEGFYILEEMIFREPKWLINIIKAYISEINNYKHEQNKLYWEFINNVKTASEQPISYDELLDVIQSEYKALEESK